jgi:hypothetical protein
MAKLNKIMFGKVNGKFGEAVFHQRNGINYISQTPAAYTTPSTEAFQQRTNKFRIASRVAKLINSFPLLKETWFQNTPKGQSTYNYLISKNYTAVNGTNVTDLLMIVPESKVGVRLNNSTVSTDKLTISLKPLTESAMVDITVEKKIKLCSLIFLSAPQNENSPQFDAIIVFSSMMAFDLQTGLTFEIPFSTSDEKKIAQYQTKSVHSTIITYSDDDVPVNYSSTF